MKHPHASRPPHKARKQIVDALANRRSDALARELDASKEDRQAWVILVLIEQVSTQRDRSRDVHNGIMFSGGGHFCV